MDDNASSIAWRRRNAGRQTLSQLDDGIVNGTLDFGLARSFYNGFEMWWLAGMPITLVVVLTVLSFSLASGVNRLGKSVHWEGFPAVAVKRMVGRLRELKRVDEVVQVEERSSEDDDAGVRMSMTVPGHIAVIMDGNRRYGKNKYGEGVRGHADGSKTLVQFTDWCMDAGIKMLTVFAFSTGEGEGVERCDGRACERALRCVMCLLLWCRKLESRESRSRRADAAV